MESYVEKKKRRVATNNFVELLTAVLTSTI